MDEVGDASLQVDVSAISKMYRKREEALNTAIKTVEDIAKANNENKGTLSRTNEALFVVISKNSK